MLLSFGLGNFLLDLEAFGSMGGDTSPVRDFDRLNFGRILSFDKLVPTFDKLVRSCLKFAGD